jgi:hypothetical protein
MMGDGFVGLDFVTSGCSFVVAICALVAGLLTGVLEVPGCAVHPAIGCWLSVIVAVSIVVSIVVAIVVALIVLDVHCSEGKHDLGVNCAGNDLGIVGGRGGGIVGDWDDWCDGSVSSVIG